MKDSKTSIQNLEGSNFPELKKRPWVSFLVLLFSVFTDTVLFGTNINNSFTSFQRYFVIIISLVLTLFTYSRKTLGWMAYRNLYGYVSLAFIFITLVSVGRLFNGYYYYTVIACLLIAMNFSKICSLEEFALRFVRVMTFIAVFSICVYCLRDKLYDISFIPTITNTSGYSYKCLLFSNIPSGVNHRYRNEGPYWEAGVYQAYLNIALMFTLFFDNSKWKKYRAILFSITAITTFSGAALIPLMLSFGAYVFNIKESPKGKGTKIAVVLSLLFIIILGYESGVFDEMIQKVSGGVSGSSFAYRWSSLYSDITSFLKHPFWGTSPDILDERRNAVGAFYGVSNVGITNTFAGWFALFGFSLGSLMAINYWRVSGFIGNSIFSRILLFAAFVAMTSNENLTSSPLFFVIPFLVPKDNLDNNYSGDVIRFVLRRN